MTTPIDFAIPASKAVWLHEGEAVAERHRSALPWVRLYIFATSGYKQAHEDNQRAAFRFSCSGRERARMTDGKDRVAIAKALKIPLDRDVFTRTLIRELAGALEDVIGIEEASGYISIVGSAIGEQINQDYRRAYEVSSLSRGQVADVLVDLKRRIQGNFFIIEERFRPYRGGKPSATARWNCNEPLPKDTPNAGLWCT